MTAISKTTKAGAMRATLDGGLARLDATLPRGLFEGDSGSKYLIGENDDSTKFAIVLAHKFLPSFTWFGLTRLSLEEGRWLGPWELCLTHRATSATLSDKLGRIDLWDLRASICCRPIGGGETHWLGLGYVGTKGYVGSKHFASRDFDGWSIEPLLSDDPFFRLLPYREYRLRDMKPPTW